MKGLLMNIVWIVAIVLGFYILFAGYLFIFQSNLLYYPHREITSDPGRLGLPFENISFVTNDGFNLSGWYIPHENSRGVLLFCHGNAGNIGHRLDSILLFHQLGLEICIFDYRGYGNSEGKPSEQGTYRDAQAAWQYLVEERQVAPGNLVIFGRSLGGSIAAWLASNNNPGVLIVESTFTSVPDLAAKIYPYLPVRLMSRFKYDTARYMKEVKCPTLIVHSRNDEMMPFVFGQKLYEIASEPKGFLKITGTHNEGFIISGPRYEEGLNMFISEHLKP